MIRQHLLTLLLAGSALMTPQLTSAALVTWNFSGTVHPGPPVNFGAPITDFMPNVVDGDPFTGSVTYDTAATANVPQAGTLQYLGQPLAVHVLLSGQYPLDLTLPEANDNARLETTGPGTVGAYFDKYPTAAETMTSFDPDVLIDRITVMGVSSTAAYPTGATSLANFDFLAPGIDLASLVMQLRGPNPLYPAFGDPQEIVLAGFFIESFTLVPEPSSLALGACGTLGLVAITRWRGRRARQFA